MSELAAGWALSPAKGLEGSESSWGLQSTNTAPTSSNKIVWNVHQYTNLQPYSGIVDSLKNEEIDLHMVCSSPMKIEMEYFTQSMALLGAKKWIQYNLNLDVRVN